MDDRVERAQVDKCVGALLAYLKRESKTRGDGDSEKSKKLPLFTDAEAISVTVGLKQMPTKKKVNAYRIPLKHSLYADKEICLISKDPQSEYEELLSRKPVEEVKQVISVGTLRKKFGQYSNKRDLFASYDMFLADDRVLPLLPPLLGKKFFKGKQPVPVALKNESLFQKRIAAARDSTYLYMRGGTCVSVKVAYTDFTREQIVDNIMAVLPGIIRRIPHKWGNVQVIHVKTDNSVALPIYKRLPRHRGPPADAAAATEKSKP